MPQLTRHPCFLLSPGGPLSTVRRYTTSVTLLVLGTLIPFLEFNHSILKRLEINIHIHTFQILTSQHTYASFKYKHTILSFIIHIYLPLKSIPAHTLFSPSPFPTFCMLTIHIPHIRHNHNYIVMSHALAIPIHLKYDYHVPNLS